MGGKKRRKMWKKMVREQVKMLSTSKQVTNTVHYLTQRGQTMLSMLLSTQIKHTFSPSSDGNTRISDTWSYLNSYIAHTCRDRNYGASN